MLQIGVGFQRVGVIAPNRGAARAGAGRIAALHGKAVLAAPDRCVIVVSAAGQPHKVVNGHRCGIRVKHGAHLAKGGVKNGDDIAAAGRGELPLTADEISRTGGRGLFFAAAAGAQQGQRQRGQQTEFFVHGGNLRKNPIKTIIPQNFPLEHP